MAIQEKLYTAEDLWELSHRPEYSDMHLELSEGRLIVMPPAGWEHGGAVSELGRVIGNYVADNRLGMTTGAETGYILYKNPDPKGKDTVRAPDVGFIAAARVPDVLPKKYVPFAPDLAVEVVSPNDTDEEIAKKVREYLQFGTRMVVVVYPDSRTVAVHTPTGRRTLTEADTLDGGHVLPGFKLAVRDIFSRRAD